MVTGRDRLDEGGLTGFVETDGEGQLRRRSIRVLEADGRPLGTDRGHGRPDERLEGIVEVGSPSESGGPGDEGRQRIWSLAVGIGHGEAPAVHERSRSSTDGRSDGCRIVHRVPFVRHNGAHPESRVVAPILRA
jgi:hypothetical protein